VDPSVVPVISLGAAAFWIALAAVLIAGSYFKWRREAQKQQTLLRLVERTGQLDEQQVKLLFPPPPPPGPLPPHWFPPPNPDAGRQMARIFGTLALSVAVGLTIFFTIRFNFGTALQQENAITGFGAASLIACVGVGLFIATRFMAKPVNRDRQDT
jgi:hypothetical protein